MKSFRLLALLGLASLSVTGSAWAAQGERRPFSFPQLPNGGRPETKIPFPIIIDRSTIKIALDRGGCLGTCPNYQVEISADGTVRYNGGRFVLLSGAHESHIPPEAVGSLYDAFIKADFFWTLDSYHAPITDLPTYIISISFDGNTKTVRDYAGVAIGMPREIAELEAAIDTAADTKKWVRGDESTFASLVAENWDFSARDDDHLSLIESAAQTGNLDFLNKLLGAGVNADSSFGCKGMQAAARQRRVDILSVLSEAGAPVHWDARYDNTCDVLGAAVLSGAPEIVRAILDRRPDVNWPSYSSGKTPLVAAATSYSSNRGTEPGFAAIVRMLTAAGAKDINTPMYDGQTLIMRSSSPEVAQALLEGGADPWIANWDSENAFQFVSRTRGANNAVAGILRRWMDAHPKAQ